jgi:predicted ribosome quality control (RQC) complex YloA/Tae2 family protein
VSRFGPLNWKEVARLAPLLDSEIRGAFVDRVVVPARAQLPDGFLKGEWVIRLTGKCLLLSVRPRAPYFALLPGKGPEAAERGTRSGFDLALSKYLRGAKVVAVRALPRERALEIEFAGQLVLLVLLIPATPEAVLIDRAKDEVLHRSRNLPPEKFVAPDGTHAPPDLAARDLTLAELRTQIEASLTTEAFALRRTRAEKLARESRKKFADRERQSRTAGEEAAQEADWQKYGELLKASLPNPPPLVRGVRKLLDYATGETIEVPGDPKLDAAAQVAKYFSLAKRQAKRRDHHKFHTRA